MSNAEPIIDRYVEEVLSHLPPSVPERERVAADVRAHLEEAASASGSPGEAVREMGSAPETAEGYAAGLDLEPASLVDRTGAFLADIGLGVAVSLALFAGSVLMDGAAFSGPDGGIWSAILIRLAGLFGLLALLYFPVLETLYGQTIGKRLFGLCVAREDGLRAEWWRTVIRRLPLFFEIFWLDALFAPFTERRQRAFDLVAKTIVVPGRSWGGRAAGWAVAALPWMAILAGFLVFGVLGVPSPF